jgi:hypothetical protein
MKNTSFWVHPLVKLGHLYCILRRMLPFVYYRRPSVITPRVSRFLKALKQDEARALPVGAAGIAWGGYFVIRAC